MTVTMDKIVALAKNKAFVFPGSEIYGGLSNTWDYGPLGIELKNNIKRLWWKKFVQEDPNNVGLDAAILMNPKVWHASGHVGGFSDPLIDCRDCNERFRADTLIEDFYAQKGQDISGLDGKEDDELMEIIRQEEISCPSCGEINFTEPRRFNLMFKTFQGVTEDSQDEIYLRPETAQGIFVNFRNVQRSMRKKIPFGIGQQGKSFRNEITPGNFIFRTREFEQMELQFFCEPGTDEEWYDYWKSFCFQWIKDLGVNEENLRFRDHDEDELSFYSKETADIEYLFPFGWGEIWGIANRTDYDLSQHIKEADTNLYYRDPHTNEEYIPYVIEPSVGTDRLLLMFLVDAYEEEELEDGSERTVLKFHPAIAPYKAAVLPLTNKLKEEAEEIYKKLSKYFMVDMDTGGSIGRRYRRQDEAGTPFCITVDFDTLEDNTVTIRDRDTMEQFRIPIDELKDYLEEKTSY